jgi:putative ABC transport system substrate-binding protein
LAGTAAAQAPVKVARVGVLGPRTQADAAPFLDAFRQGMRELGWLEGQNLVLESRWAEGKSDRVPALVADLLRSRVDVIFAGTTLMTVETRKATSTVPIVAATIGADPVKLGLAASLARPGGNVTGLSFTVDSETFGKQLQLLKETVPATRRVAVLFNPTNPAYGPTLENLKIAARSMGVELQFVEARGPDDLERAFTAMARWRAQALLVVADPILALDRTRLLDQVAGSRLPAMYGLRELVEAGGLISYAVDLRDNYRRAAAYVDKILRGAKPGDLPIEQPAKFELIVNLRTAKAFGLTIPRSVLLRADQVIE